MHFVSNLTKFLPWGLMACCLVTIVGTTFLALPHSCHSLQLICCMPQKFHLWVSDLQMSCSDLTKCISASLVVPVMATRATCFFGNESTLVQVMACDLFGAKPLSKRMLAQFLDVHVCLQSPGL